MKMMKRGKAILRLLVFSILLSGISCGGSGNQANESDGGEQVTESAPLVKLIRLKAPSENTRFASGDKIGLEIELLGERVPDSVAVFLDGHPAGILYGPPWNMDVATGSSRMGRLPLKAIAYSGDSRPHTVTSFILLFSDIVPKQLGYRVINRFPHDPGAYTQGLLVHNGFMYESTGQEGKSTLRKVDIESGEVLKEHRLENKYFGEGLVLVGNRLYQITWQHNTGFVYDLDSFTEIRRIHYDTQGWGLTSNGDMIYMSDGTNKIYFIEPEYFTVTGSVEVFDNEKAVYQLNELEYIDGELWANIYMTDLVARIDPETGKVLSYINLSGLVDSRALGLNSEQVLNGIAWDKDNNRLFVTGKDWPWLFEISVR